LVDDGGELAGHLAVQSLPEDLGDLVGSQLRSKSLWMGKLRLKMKSRQYSICEID
jgi:hypothetical protein